MSELPDGWTPTPLGEVAEFEMGQAPPGAACNKDGVGTPFVKAGEFGEERPIIREWTTKPLKFARSTDVLICVVGATAGKLNLGADCAIGRSAAAIRPTNAIDQFFLHRFLKTRVSDLRAGSTGSAQGVISKTALAGEVIPLPPLPEQRRIVAKLDRLSARTKAARTHLARVQSLATRAKQATLAAAFRGDLTKDWRGDPATRGWETRLVGDLLTGVGAGKNLKCEERPPLEDERGVVKVSAVTWGSFDASQAKTLPTRFQPTHASRITTGDFLFSRANTIELVGACVIVDEAPENLFLSDKVLRLEIEEAEKPWLLHFLRSPAGRASIESGSTGNQLSMRNLSQKALKAISLPWPTENERSEIVRRIEAAFARIDRMVEDATRAAHLLDRLDQRLLAKAFRGELVPQDPTDEPADQLLARIQTARAAAPKPKRGRRTRA